MEMKLMASSLLALVASGAATASPAFFSAIKRQVGGPGVGPVCKLTTEPSTQDVLNALNQWLTDVVNVNTFLNSAHDNFSNATLLEGLALGALNNAMDEPTQLGILACIPGLSDDAEKAVTSANAGFGNNVLTPLSDITTNGTHTTQVMTDVNTINRFRCCTLLPDLDTLWPSVAEDEGLVGQVTLNPPRPNACSSLAC